MPNNIEIGSYWVCMSESDPALDEFTLFAKVVHVDDTRNYVYVIRTQAFGFVAVKPELFELQTFLEFYKPAEDIICCLKS